MENHLLSHLERGTLSFVESLDVEEATTSVEPLLADDASLEYLATCRLASQTGGKHEVVLTSSKADLPVFAAVSHAWDYQASASPQLVVLVTKQQDAIEVAHRHRFPNTIWTPQGRYNMLNVCSISRRVQNIDKALTPQRHDVVPRLIITNYYDPSLHEALGGDQVQAIYVDGRSIRIGDLELPTRTPVVHTIVSPLQQQDGWTQHPITPPKGNATGRLSSPLITPGPPQVIGVPDPAPLLWSILDRLRHIESAAIFNQEARNVAWFLNALAVRPDALQRQFVRFAKRQTHALYGVLEILTSIAAATKDEALQSDMVEFNHEALQACDRLNGQNPKYGVIKELVQEHPGALVVVRGRGNCDALRLLLEEGGIIANVVSWRDNVNWMPHDGLVIFASPPPPERFWLLAPNCQVGRHMTFIFTPKEVASLRRAIHRAGRAQDDPKPGTLQHALRNVQFEDPNDGEGDDLLTTRMPPDLMDWLDSINERGKGGRWDGEFQGGNMYCMTLSDGDRYYVGMHTKVAVFRPSGIVEVKALDVEQGEVLLLPAQKDEINMSLKDAVLNAYEAKEPEHRERVEAWKESVVDKAQCLGIETAEALCAKLRGLGAIDIDVKNIDETFYSWGMIAPRNEWHLVKATTVLCPGKFNPDEVRTSINRLRGMRRMGGKFLKRYAALSYITDHDDLHARFEKDFKLTHQDILNLVRPCPVINISPPLQAPERINNFLSEAMNQ